MKPFQNHNSSQWSFRNIMLSLLVVTFNNCQPTEKIAELNEAQLDHLLLESPFIFVGSISEEGGQSTRLNPNEIKVSVKEVIKAPKNFQNYQGRVVYITRNKANRASGETIFFTNATAFGKGLKLQEMASFSTKKTKWYDLLQKKAVTLPNRLLEEHLLASELVISGVVEAIISSDDPDQLFISEHYPHWQAARIKINTVEFGNYTKPTLLVPFPKSEDVSWWKKPKFNTGQKGIWILHPHSKDPNGEGVFEALHASDFIPSSSLSQTRAVLSNINSKATTK